MFAVVSRRNFSIMLGTDVLLCFGAYVLAYVVRFDAAIPLKELETLGRTVLWVVPLKIAFFFCFGLYRGMWRYAGIHALIQLLRALSAATGVILLAILVLYRFEGFSRGVFVIDFLLAVVFVGGFRLAVRLVVPRLKGNKTNDQAPEEMGPARRLLIIGAGNGGEKLLREINENRGLNYNVVGFVDDDRSKLKLTIHGVKVLGSLKDLVRITKESGIDEMIIAVASASAVEMRRIVTLCKSTNLPFKTVPGISELIAGKINVSAIREVRYEDLLGRKPVEIDEQEVGRYLNGKRIMVTGAAGSIGSELCRQIARFKPAVLAIVDMNESGLYDMEMEFRMTSPELEVRPCLIALQRKRLMQKIFDEYRPEVVFHAAAYKHVPMMELYPWEAIFNNVLGTQALLDLCIESNVEKCVIVSTDKAVRPSSVMGASKRLTEMLAQAYAKKNHCRIMAVRFGNVIGSAGSVVPLFRKQIAQGGPVTVTHKEMTRFFMTIPEACRLILQAGAIGEGGEIFVLKMGTPISVDSLARDMISLSGFKPDEDIAVKYVGLRPGEKLHEELVTEGEDVTSTCHEKILVLSSKKEVGLPKLIDDISDLARLAVLRSGDRIRSKLSEIIEEYRPAGAHPIIAIGAAASGSGKTISPRRASRATLITANIPTRSAIAVSISSAISSIRQTEGIIVEETLKAGAEAAKS